MPFIYAFPLSLGKSVDANGDFACSPLPHKLTHTSKLFSGRLGNLWKSERTPRKIWND